MGGQSVLVARWSVVQDAIPRVGDVVGRSVHRRERVTGFFRLTTSLPAGGRHCGLGNWARGCAIKQFNLLTIYVNVHVNSLNILCKGLHRHCPCVI